MALKFLYILARPKILLDGIVGCLYLNRAGFVYVGSDDLRNAAWVISCSPFGRTFPQMS